MRTGRGAVQDDENRRLSTFSGGRMGDPSALYVPTNRHSAFSGLILSVFFRSGPVFLPEISAQKDCVAHWYFPFLGGSASVHRARGTLFGFLLEATFAVAMVRRSGGFETSGLPPNARVEAQVRCLAFRPKGNGVPIFFFFFGPNTLT